jgi:hypothetical protein
MSEHVYFISLGLFFGTILGVFGLKYLSAAYQAHARMAGDDAYRTLAEKSAATQSEAAASLSLIQGELSDIKLRLIAVENILKAVE